MLRINPLRSVVVRLAAALVVGGVAMSAALHLLEQNSSEANLQIVVTQDAGRVVRAVQAVLRSDPSLWSRHELVEILPALSSDTQLVGMRITRETGEHVEIGSLPPSTESSETAWLLHEWALPKGNEVSITRLTRVQAPFMSDGKRSMLEMVIDGAEARNEVEDHLRSQTRLQWVVLTVMTLLGMFLLRRWIGAPLIQIVQLVNTKAGPRPFNEMAGRTHGEFSDLAAAIGGMLSHLEETGDALTRSERAFRDLYELAPAAMLSLDAKGNICEANPRAAVLLGVESDRALLGQPLIEFVRPEDRGLLRQAMDRLYLDPVTRCELRLGSGERTIDAAIECAGVRSEDGVLHGVHLSMLDMCESKQLQRQVAHKSHLLNLVLDHISSAILLVDSNNKIAAHNQKLTALSHAQARILVGQRYDAESFWHNLGVIDRELFVRRLRQIELEHDRPAQERFETQRGTFLFQGVPVNDNAGAAVGRLWMVQDISQQEQHQKLLRHQGDQLQAIRRLGTQFTGANRLGDVLEGACRHLFDVFGVEAMGIAARRDAGNSRSIQMLHRGTGPMLLETNRELVEAIERHLMPDALSKPNVSHWPELPKNAEWAKAFAQAGLTSVAAAQLKSKADAHGILWIARRGGERIDAQHLYLLEALAPFIASHLENAQLRERLLAMDSADPLTGLPNADQFVMEINRMSHRPGLSWNVVIVRLDHFRQLNEKVSHSEADSVLYDVAKALQRATRKSCVVARLDGAMFAVLSPAGGLDEAAHLGERLRKVVAEMKTVLPSGETWPLTASVGVAACPDDGSHAVIVVRASARADAAKRLGGNRVITEGPDVERLAS